ncbi:MAG: phospholipid carrier-dependent glycosyltransferase [Nostocaceae cyanobacterium]|nr:phospholipid carrier-dependent glycosyltransferase [Nostocaceae cyanobacterium]
MTKKWFWLSMAGVFLLSLALRFWGLGRFNTLVFDEVYYAKFGHDYLTHNPFFDGHPPVGKYMVAIGMLIGRYFSFGGNEVNGLTGGLYSPISYRWVTALFGSFLPLIIAGIAYQISQRRSFAFLAALFTAVDGLFLVETRYALINIYIVIFGLLGQLCFLIAVKKTINKRRIWLLLAGINFGLSIAVKWNGLFFLAGIYGIWLIAWIGKLATDLVTDETDKLSVRNTDNLSPLSATSSAKNQKYIFQKLTDVNIFSIIFYLGIIPVVVYCIAWIPHLMLSPNFGFIEVHQKIWQFHQQLGGNDSHIHPYCSPWYSWILMLRPMAYYYQTAQSVNEPLPVMGPPLPSGTGKVFYDVHAMGNPFLWWFSLAAIVFLFGMLGWLVINKLVQQKRLNALFPLSTNISIILYLLLNYAINLLPWVRVTRCLFIYHYMTAIVFGFMALAWLVDQCLRSYYIPLRSLGVTVIFIVLIAFVFWIPLYLGLPLSPEEYKLRMWFTSWI